MGDLSFTLTVKSDLERKMKSYSDAIKQAKKEVDNLQSALATAKTAKDSSAITSLNQQLKEAKANVRDMESNWKRADTRMQQVLDKAHDIDNVLKSMSASSSKAKFFNAADAENAVNRISSAIRSLLELTRGGANAPLFTGEGFRAGIGDVKRGIADVKSGFKDITSDAKAAEKSVNDFGKAENKAAEYYRTRKQRVDDAISSLSKKQAEFARLQQVSSADDVRMLKAASEQAEILKQRLLAAKTEYEQMQRFKAMGVPGAALSSTFLGRYTGMSELFGANFSKFAGQGFRDLLGSNFSKQDNLSYNNFTAMAKEIVELAKQHNTELEKRLKLEEREAELLAKQNTERRVSVKNTQMDTAPIEKQIEQYEKAIAAYKEMKSIQEQMRAAVDMGGLKGGAFLGSEYAGLEQKLQAFKEAFATFGNGFGIEKVQSELQTLYALLEQFNAANANAKPLISETHDEFTLEKQRLAQQEKHQLRQQEIEDAFRAQDAERKNAEANAQTERRVHDELIRLQNERRQNQLDNLAKIEAKERELAELYSKLRSSRDNGLKNGADVSQIEKDLQAVRELYSEMQRLRRDVPTDKGWNPIGFSASETASMQRHMQGVATEVQRIRSEAQGATNAARDLASAFDRVHNSASKSSQVLSDIKSLFLQGGIVFAAQQFANSIVQTGGDIVQQHIALRSILGDVQKADTIFAQTQQLALQSPFTFQQLNRDVKQLAAFGVDTDRLYDTTKRLADVASGLGVSFERLGLAYGQVKARSWLDGKELRQFAYAGLPMLQKIADLYNDEGKNGKRNYTTSDVRNMITKREVSFEDVDAVFKRLTDEGGQFYNMQFVLSDTLLGKWNKLQDAWSIMLGKFADGRNIIGRTFITALNLTTGLVQNIDKLGPIFVAAFSGFAFKKAVGFLGAGLGASILKAKGSMALEYEKSALAGTRLNAVQMRILATKGQITTEDMRALVNAKAINAQELRRLYITRQITTAQYQQLMGMSAIGGKVTRFSAWLRLLRMQGHTFVAGTLGRFQAGLSIIGTGLRGLGSSILNFFGGVPGLILTGATMLLAKIWQDKEELNAAIEQSGELLQQKHQDLQNYLEKNPLRLNVDVGDLAKQIDQEKEELASKAGSLYDTIKLNMKQKVPINGLVPGEDEASQLQYLRRYMELIDDANTKAQQLAGWFTKTIDNVNGVFTESVPTNLQDLENSVTNLQVVLPKLNMKDLVADAKFIKENTASGFNDTWQNLANYILQANKNGQDLQTTLAGINSMLSKDSDVSGDHKGGLFDYAKAEVDVLQHSNDIDAQIQAMADKFKQQFPNIATDPMQQAIYTALKDAWKGANNLDVVQENYFDMKLDKAMGLQDFPSLAEDVAKDAASRMSESTKAELASGRPLTESAKRDMSNAKDAAMNKLRATWPGTAAEIRAILNSQRFDLNVWMHIQGDGSAAQSLLDSYYQGGPKKPFSNNAQGFYSQWSKGSNNVADVEKKARADVDAALEVLNSAKRQKKGIDDATKNYNNVVSAFEEVIGYSYRGSDTGTTKKIDTQNSKRQKAADAARRARERAAERARREAERRERAYIRARQKEGETIQKYYDAYNSWKQIEGIDKARARVSADKRFGNISGTYDDPAKLAKNYEKLANSILKASGGYAKMSDERRQLYNDYMAKAADQEAKIELENANKLIDSFQEMLDLLSKRYDWYERLSKVAGRDFAAAFAFDTKSHSSDYYHYIKEKVLGGLTGSSYVNLGTESDGLNPVGKRVGKDQVLLDNVTASAKYFPKINLDQIKPGTTLEEALLLPFNELVDKLGKKSATWLKKLKEERDKLDEATVKSMEDALGSLNDYSAQIDDINLKYDNQIERLQERNKLEKDNDDYISKETLDNSTAILNRQRNKEIADINYKQFQKSDVWLRFFGASFLLSTRGAEMYRKTIENGVNKAFQEGAISAEDYAKAIQDINEQTNNINRRRSALFNYLTGGFESVNSQQKEDAQKEIDRGTKIMADARDLIQRGKVTPGQEGENLLVQGESMMTEGEKIKAGGDAMMKGANNAASTVAVIDKVVHGINNNVQKLKALIDDIAQSIEVFAGKEHADNFKNSSGYAFISGFSSASQGATDAWDSLKSGNVMGVVEGGYRSIIGWAEPWAKRHDEKLAKQIQIAERTNKLIDSMRSSIERRLTNSLGGVYGYKAKDSDLKTIRDGLDNYSLAKKGAKYGRNTVAQSVSAGVATGAAFGTLAGPIGLAAGALIGGILGGLFGHKRKKYKTNYSEDTFASMEKANQTQEYYDQMYASYKMQRDNLNAQMNAESKKKNKDKDKIQDYKTQLGELDDKIQSFAKDMAKSLYDIDVKQWASELTDAVVSAWAAGEDAVEAYRDKVKDLMKSLATNIISQKIMQLALKPVETYIEKVMDAQSGKLNEDNIIAVADMLGNIGDSTIPSIIDLMNKLKDKGWDLSDTSSASMSGSIKGITENTGDLLAAYLNAIRADVSVIRQLTSTVFPELNVTATAQLQQLNMIAENTRRNAESAEVISRSTEEILYIFRAVTNDTKRISVNVKG